MQSGLIAFVIFALFTFAVLWIETQRQRKADARARVLARVRQASQEHMRAKAHRMASHAMVRSAISAHYPRGFVAPRVKSEHAANASMHDYHASRVA